MMDGGRFKPRLALLLLLLPAACQSPSAAFDRAAADRGFQRSRVAGEGFGHIVFHKAGDNAGPLHVYLESDGRPWLRRQLPAGDPTSRDPLVPDLMALDPAESLLLGRPCYHGLEEETLCTPALWTARRFAPEVVASLAAAVRRVTGGGRPLVLIGHSGGGVLAMLLAARLPETRAVVTIAAPLDHAAWTAYHRYLPLEGSLNPALAPPLPPSVRQLHFAGGRDGVVPPVLISDALAEMKAPPPLIVTGFDHHDGWASLWPAVLSCLGEAGRSEAVAQADEDDVLLTPGVAEVAVVAGGDGGPLVECHRH